MMVVYSPNYGFIWEKLQDTQLLHGSLPMKANGAPWVHWWLKDANCPLQVTTNILCNHAMSSLSWLSPKVEKGVECM